MTKELVTLYHKLLFTLPSTTPTLKTYAIVDSARDESLKEKVSFSGLDYVDLWHEELWENELTHPLYLVALDEKNTLLAYLLSKHDESIATYFISPYGLEALQGYYSKYTHVHLEVIQDNFQKALFGFYDPNTLPRYAQALYTQEKAEAFFKGVVMWLSPSVEKEDALFLASKNNNQVVEAVWLDLGLFKEVENPTFNFDTLSYPTTPDLVDHAHEIYIDQKTLSLMEQSQKEMFIDVLFEAYEADGYNIKAKEAHYKQKAVGLLDEAKDIQIERQDMLYDFILYGLSIAEPISTTELYAKLVSQEEEEEKKNILSFALWQSIQEIREVNHG